MVILEACSPSKRVSMPVSSNSPYFYLHLPFLKDMVFSPFSPFFAKVMKALDSAPSQLLHNSWGIIMAFEMVCEGLKFSSSFGIFFSFYATKPLKGGWVSLDSLSRRPVLSLTPTTTRIGDTCSPT